MDCSFKAPFTGLRIEPTTVVFQASLLWSIQPYKTTGTCLSAQVIERSSRKEIPITKSTPPPRFTWLILTVWLCLSELSKGHMCLSMLCLLNKLYIKDNNASFFSTCTLDDFIYISFSLFYTVYMSLKLKPFHYAQNTYNQIHKENEGDVHKYKGIGLKPN